MDDVRIQWIKEKTLKLFGETDGHLFDDLLAENDGALEDKMISFLDGDIIGTHNLERRAFFLYKTYIEKIVEEEVLVPEEGK